MQESEVKNLTGGDTVTARQIYGKPISFSPTHKLALYGNHKLVITGADSGIWRRVKMVPFVHEIPEDRRMAMSEVLKIMESELPGILNWSIEGYRLYKEEGLTDPAIVSASTQEYRDANDTLKLYIEEHLAYVEKAKIKLSDVLNDYMIWCKYHKKRAKYDTSKVLAAELRKRGFIVEAGTGNASFILNYERIDFNPFEKQKEDKEEENGESQVFEE